MKPFETITVSGKTYNLKLTCSEMAKLETKLGSDVLTGMEKLAQVRTLADYYFAAAKPFNDDITTIEDVYQLFDDYIIEGGNYEDLQLNMVKVLVVSGIMSEKAFNIMSEASEKQKAALEKLITENGNALSV